MMHLLYHKHRNPLLLSWVQILHALKEAYIRYVEFKHVKYGYK